MSDKIEKLIKQYLEDSSGRVSGRREDLNYPSSADLNRYLQDELEGPELERMLVFLRGSVEGQALVTRARRLMESESGWENEKVAPESLSRAKSLMRGPSQSTQCPHCGKSITPFKRSLGPQKWTNLAWFLLALGGFLLSFVFRHYFIQFLVVTVLAGVKAIVEMRATRTQILIYKALTEDTAHGHSRLHEVKNRDGGI